MRAIIGGCRAPDAWFDDPGMTRDRRAATLAEQRNA